MLKLLSVKKKYKKILFINKLNLLSFLLFSNIASASLIDSGIIAEENIDKYTSAYGDYKPPMSFSTDFQLIDYEKNLEVLKQTEETKKLLEAAQKQDYAIHHEQIGKTCWDGAGEYYGIDPWLLRAIAKVESGFNPNAIGKNKNGTIDIGMMQINDKVWLPVLARNGISKKMLHDPCVSVYVGAWILKQNFQQYGYTPFAIGAYNSRTPAINKVYREKVYAAYNKITKNYKINREE